MSQRNLIIGAVILIVLIGLFYFMRGEAPAPEVVVEPPAAEEPAPAAPTN